MLMEKVSILSTFIVKTHETKQRMISFCESDFTIVIKVNAPYHCLTKKNFLFALRNAIRLTLSIFSNSEYIVITKNEQ